MEQNKDTNEQFEGYKEAYELYRRRVILAFDKEYQRKKELEEESIQLKESVKKLKLRNRWFAALNMATIAVTIIILMTINNCSNSYNHNGINNNCDSVLVIKKNLDSTIKSLNIELGEKQNESARLKSKVIDLEDEINRCCVPPPSTQITIFVQNQNPLIITPAMQQELENGITETLNQQYSKTRISFTHKAPSLVILRLVATNVSSNLQIYPTIIFMGEEYTLDRGNLNNAINNIKEWFNKNKVIK